MTWEETIKYIRTQPEYAYLVEKAYLDEHLELNVKRYMNEEEWKETHAYVKKYAPAGKNILDVGSGNGISAIAFALSGYHVTVLEPDKSDTVGCGAIKKLKHHYQLTNIQIIEAFAENASLQDSTFDIVYCRQSMHHANNLKTFVKNITTSLKPGGIFFSVRDHVVYNKKDKEWFLQSHPLQKFYEGENAYSSKEYQNAIQKAGLSLIKELKHFESIINYFPLTHKEFLEKRSNWEGFIRNAAKKIPFASSKLLYPLFKGIYLLKNGNVYNEKLVPGRMYSYIALKK